MIFDTIKYGTFTADDFINAQRSNDYSKFTSLPLDLRKQFISSAIHHYSSRENIGLKQAGYNFIDGKIDEAQYKEVFRKYWGYWYRSAAAPANVTLSVAVAHAPMVAAAIMAGASMVLSIEHWQPMFDQHASLLNKLIKEYEYVN